MQVGSSKRQNHNPQGIKLLKFKMRHQKIDLSLSLCTAIYAAAIKQNQYLSLPSGSNIWQYIWSCRASAIYDIAINWRYIHKRCPPLVHQRNTSARRTAWCRRPPRSTSQPPACWRSRWQRRWRWGGRDRWCDFGQGFYLGSRGRRGNSTWNMAPVENMIWGSSLKTLQQSLWVGKIIPKTILRCCQKLC